MEPAGAGTTGEPPATEGVARSGKRPREGPLLFGAQLIKDEGQDGEPTEAATQGAGDAVPSASPAKAESVLVAKARLHCSLCSGYLKRPIYLCAAGHLTCCSCRVKLLDSGCATCRDRGAVAAYAHCPGLDLFFHDLRVACAYEQYGCKAYAPYFLCAAHQKECEHAPCFCPEPGCSLGGSSRMLLAHLSGKHSWLVQEIPYGEPRLIAVTVPAADSPERDRRLLRGDDMSVFLMAVGPLGEGAAVSLVLVRANSPVPRPRFVCTFYANPHPEAAGLDGGYFFATMPVRSSTLADGAGVAPEKEMYFAVPREMLHKASRELLLSVRIDRSTGPEAVPPVHDDR